MHTLKDRFTRHSNSPVPHKTRVARLVDRFPNDGSVNDKKCSGRPSVLTNERRKTLDRLMQTPKQIGHETWLAGVYALFRLHIAFLYCRNVRNRAVLRLLPEISYDSWGNMGRTYRIMPSLVVKHSFILTAMWTTKTLGCGLVNIHASSTNILYIIQKLGYGALSLVEIWWNSLLWGYSWLDRTLLSHILHLYIC
jgi:hypothetical protein